MDWRGTVRCASQAVLDAVYPPQCALCGTMGDPAYCSPCRDETEWLEPRVTTLVQPDPLTGFAAATRYAGRSAQAVTRLKYGRHTALAEPMAATIARLVAECRLDDVDWVVPVPIHWLRRCSRGFNQAELLASALPPARVRPELLRRVRWTRPQASLPADRRDGNLVGAFACTADIAGAHILLVDDVLTSGATVRECATSLRSRGARSVSAVVFASGMP